MSAPAEAAAEAALTLDEATVYDRQLRVWGVEVQKKLTAARVLIAGFGKLSAEIAKNITLAGVGNVALLDDSPASQHEGSSFLIATPAPQGATCTEAAARTLQAMNPLVRVSCAPGAASEQLLDPQLLGQFDLVIAVGQPLRVARCADALCAERGVKFMAAAVKGASSFYFADLGSHDYKPKADDSGRESAGHHQIEYARLSQVLETPFDQLPGNCHPTIPVLLACAALEEELGRPLTPDDALGAASALRRLAPAAPAHGAVWADAAARQLPGWVAAVGEFAPVAAVVGGVVGNDVIRAVSHSDVPVNNIFLYDLSGQSAVQTMPPPGSAAAEAAAAAAAKQQRRAGDGGREPEPEVLDISD